MNLTGKTKDLFEDWFQLNNGHISLSDGFLQEFYEMPDSFQWGVYQDFFDSVNIIIGDRPFHEFFIPVINMVEGKFYRSRPEARKVAIEKANEFLNKVKG